MKLLKLLKESIKDSDIKDMKDYIRKYSDFEFISNDGKVVEFTTSKNGDVENRKHSSIDYNRGKALIKNLQQAFWQYEYKLSTEEQFVSIFVTEKKKSNTPKKDDKNTQMSTKYKGVTVEMEDMIDYVEKNSSFSYDGIYDMFTKTFYLQFSTRDNGNHAKSQYSPIDYKKAKELIQKLKRFYPKYKYSIDTADEWVNIVVDIPANVLKGKI